MVIRGRRTCLDLSPPSGWMGNSFPRPEWGGSRSILLWVWRHSCSQPPAQASAARPKGFILGSLSRFGVSLVLMAPGIWQVPSSHAIVPLAASPWLWKSNHCNEGAGSTPPSALVSLETSQPCPPSLFPVRLEVAQRVGAAGLSQVF